MASDTPDGRSGIIHKDEAHNLATAHGGCKILVKGLTPEITQEDLELHFEHRSSGGGEIADVKINLQCNNAVITFIDPLVCEAVTKRQHILNKATLTVEKYVETMEDVDKKTIIVEGLSGQVHERMLVLYFENKRKSGGGDISKLTMLDPDRARIAFIKEKDAEEVLKRSHKLKSQVLTVSLISTLVAEMAASSTHDQGDAASVTGDAFQAASENKPSTVKGDTVKQKEEVVPETTKDKISECTSESNGTRSERKTAQSKRVNPSKDDPKTEANVGSSAERKPSKINNQPNTDKTSTARDSAPVATANVPPTVKTDKVISQTAVQATKGSDTEHAAERGQAKDTKTTQSDIMTQSKDDPKTEAKAVSSAERKPSKINNQPSTDKNSAAGGSTPVATENVPPAVKTDKVISQKAVQATKGSDSEHAAERVEVQDTKTIQSDRVTPCKDDTQADTANPSARTSTKQQSAGTVSDDLLKNSKTAEARETHPLSENDMPGDTSETSDLHHAKETSEEGADKQNVVGVAAEDGAAAMSGPNKDVKHSKVSPQKAGEPQTGKDTSDDDQKLKISDLKEGSPKNQQSEGALRDSEPKPRIHSEPRKKPPPNVGDEPDDKSEGGNHHHVKGSSEEGADASLKKVSSKDKTTSQKAIEQQTRKDLLTASAAKMAVTKYERKSEETTRATSAEHDTNIKTADAKEGTSTEQQSPGTVGKVTESRETPPRIVSDESDDETNRDDHHNTKESSKDRGQKQTVTKESDSSAKKVGTYKGERGATHKVSMNHEQSKKVTKEETNRSVANFEESEGHKLTAVGHSTSKEPVLKNESGNNATALAQNKLMKGDQSAAGYKGSKPKMPSVVEGSENREGSLSFPDDVDTVEVVGLSGSDDEVSIRKRFSKLVGADGVKQVSVDDDTGTARVTFRQRTDAKKALGKKFIQLSDGNVAVLQPYRQHSEQTETDYEMPDLLTGRMIKVHGINSDSETERLKLYFENPDKSGGGPVENIEFVEANTAHVTFHNHSDAASVVSKREHTLKERDLQIEWLDVDEEQKAQEEPSSLLSTSVFVTGLPEGSTKEDIEAFFECKRSSGGGRIDYVETNDHEGQALVCFYSPTDAFNVVSQRTLKFHDREVRVTWSTTEDASLIEEENSAAEESPLDTVTVHGFTENDSEDFIKLFFESKKRSGGGEVTDINFDLKNGLAVIQFAQAEDACNVLEKYKNEQLVFGKRQLHVSVIDSGHKEQLSTSLAVEVNNICAHASNEDLIRYFSSDNVSGGAQILEIERVTEEKAVITFTNSKAADHVVKHQPQKLLDETLQLKRLKPRPSELKLPQGTPALARACYLCGMAPVTEREDIESYLALAYSNITISEVIFGAIPGTAVVYFEQSLDFELLVKLSYQRPLRGVMISVHRVARPSSVQVCNVTPDLHSQLGRYFEKMLKGSDMRCKLNLENDYATVEFNNPGIVEYITSQNEHNLGGRHLLIRPYLACLGVIPPDHDTTVPTLSKMPSPLSVDWENKAGLRFLLQRAHLRKQIEDSISSKHCNVEWPEESSSCIKLHCMLKPDMWKFHELCSEWEDEAFDHLKLQLGKFKCHEISTVPKTHKMLVTKINKLLKKTKVHGDKIAIEADEYIGIIRLAGEKDIVIELAKKVSKLESEIEKEIRQFEERITVKMTFNPWELTLWRAAKYPERILENYPDVNLHFQPFTVHITGKVSDIKAVKLAVDEVITCIVCEHVDVSDLVQEVLAVNATRDYITLQLPSNANIVWNNKANQPGLDVYSFNVEDLSNGVEVLKNCMKEVCIPVDEGTQYLYSSEKWAEIQEMTSNAMFQGKACVRVNQDCSRVHIAGTCDVFDDVQSEVSRLIKSHAVCEKIIKTSAGIARLLDKSFHSKIDKICRTHQEYGIKITAIINPRRPGVLIRGAQEGLDRSTGPVQDLIDTITSSTFTVKKPGMPKYFSTKQGKEFLDNLERRHEVGIEIDDGSSAVNEDLQGSQYTAVLSNGTKLLTMQYDLTKFPRGVIVNAANKDLMLNKGLGKAIADAGGKSIQDECYQFTKKRKGPVGPGAVCITKAGLLPCSMIIHAVGPKWQDGKAGESDALGDLIEKLLGIAEQYCISQIAIPAISTGVLRFPLAKAAVVIVESAVSYFSKNPSSCVKEVYLADIGVNTVIAFRDAMKQVCSAVTHVVPQAEGQPGAAQAVMMKSKPGNQDVGQTPSNKPTVTDTDRSVKSFTTPEGLTFTVVTGSLVQEKVDVVVNSSNKNLKLDLGYISISLLEAAGPKLQDDCKFRTLEPGDVFVTKGHQLRCKHVFHVACIKWEAPGSEKVLIDSIAKCLKEADMKCLSSISFPALGTGGLKTPLKTFAELLVKEVIKHSKQAWNKSLTDVHVVLSPKDEALCNAFLDEISSYKKLQENNDQGKHLQYSLKTDSGGTRRDGVTCKIGKVQLEVLHGDITKEKTSAIVNSIDQSFYLGGQACAAIVKAGGGDFEAECKKQKVPVKTLAVTGAGQLPCNRVIHLVAPWETSGWQAAIVAALDTTEKNKFPSLSFPALGTGGLQKKSSEIASIMMRAIHSFIKDQKPTFLRLVRVVIFNKGMLPEFTKAVEDLARRHQQDTWDVPVLLGSSTDTIQVKTVAPLAQPVTTPSHKRPPAKSLKLIVFSDDKKKIGLALEDINSMCNQKYDNKFIAGGRDQRAIAKLSDEQIRSLLSSAEKLDVKLCVEREKTVKSIEISGQADDVATVFNLVMRELIKVDRKKQEDSKSKDEILYQWSVQNQSRGTFVPYDSVLNDKIEKAYIAKKTSYSWQDGSRNFSINFEKMVESTESRKWDYKYVKRTEKGSNYYRTPKTWTPMKSPDVESVVLKRSDFEYKPVEEKLNKGLPLNTLTLWKIERIQNPALYQRYIAHKKKMPLANEEQLWHSSITFNPSDISKRGFDISRNAEYGGPLGSGVYFYKEAGIPLKKSPYRRGDKNIFLCRVLTGRSTDRHQYLHGPPAINQAQPDVKYDTVYDNGCYVIFNADQAYPEYLITYL